jgi:hypothetical protein
MDSHLSDEVLAGLRRARRLAMGKHNRLRVRAGDELFPVLAIRDDGFDLDAGVAPPLRGLVDLFDGGRHLAQCLIIRSEPEGDLIRYDFKRRTDVTDRPASDFARPDDAPVALLGRSRRADHTA